MNGESGLQTAVTEAQVEETTEWTPELPELTGTEKQVKWAEEIRGEFRTRLGRIEAGAEDHAATSIRLEQTFPSNTEGAISKIEKCLEDIKAFLPSVKPAVDKIVSSHTSAKWWIEDGREMLFTTDTEFVSEVLKAGSEYVIVPAGELVDDDTVRLGIKVDFWEGNRGVYVTYPQSIDCGTEKAKKICRLMTIAERRKTLDVMARVSDVLVLAGFKVYAPKTVIDKMTTVDRTPKVEEPEKPEPAPDKTLIAPEDVTHSGEVSIRITGNGKTVVAEYDKNEDFRSIVKDHGFYWNADNRVWVKDITRFTGSAEDRAAEIANALLKAGFTVRLKDEELRRKAVEADFEPEHTRWVMRKSDTKLMLTWAQGDDSMFDRGSRIKGAKYEQYRKFIIPVAEYMAVLDLADAMGCGISENAQKVIDAYKASIMTVSVKDAKTAGKSNRDLTDILESSRDVLDDLRDED